VRRTHPPLHLRGAHPCPATTSESPLPHNRAIDRVEHRCLEALLEMGQSRRVLGRRGVTRCSPEMTLSCRRRTADGRSRGNVGTVAHSLGFQRSRGRTGFSGVCFGHTGGRRGHRVQAGLTAVRPLRLDSLARRPATNFRSRRVEVFAPEALVHLSCMIVPARRFEAKPASGVQPSPHTHLAAPRLRSNMAISGRERRR